MKLPKIDIVDGDPVILEGGGATAALVHRAQLERVPDVAAVEHGAELVHQRRALPVRGTLGRALLRVLYLRKAKQ